MKENENGAPRACFFYFQPALAGFFPLTALSEIISLCIAGSLFGYKKR